MNDDVVTAICNPADDGTRPHVIGSTRQPCTDCTRPVWVAPSTYGVGIVEVVCIPCGLRRVDLDPHPVLLPPTRAQVADLLHRLPPPARP